MDGGGECVCNILGLSNAETKVFDVYFRELNVIIPSSFHIFYPSLLLFIFFIPVVVGWGGGFFDVMGPAPSIPAVGAALSPDERYRTNVLRSSKPPAQKLTQVQHIRSRNVNFDRSTYHLAVNCQGGAYFEI